MIILKLTKNTAYGIYPWLGRLGRKPGSEDKLKYGFSYFKLDV